MSRGRNLLVTCVSLLLLVIAVPDTGSAGERPKSLSEMLVGSWSLISLVVHQGDKKTELFGRDPRGMMILSPNGYFMTVTARAELPKFATSNRMLGTPEEYKAIGQGANAMYGTYTVDEANKTINFHVEVSTYPNWDGEVQRRVFTLDGHELRYVNPMTTIGPGNVQVVWKRISIGEDGYYTYFDGHFWGRY